MSSFPLAPPAPDSVILRVTGDDAIVQRGTAPLKRKAGAARPPAVILIAEPRLLTYPFRQLSCVGHLFGKPDLVGA
jgi:hypothetical protein